MNREDFLDLFETALHHEVGKATEEDVLGAATWFMALWESENVHELVGLKDMAEMFRDGIVGTKDMDMQEWLDLQEEIYDEEEPNAHETRIIEKMAEWGWK